MRTTATCVTCRFVLCSVDKATTHKTNANDPNAPASSSSALGKQKKPRPSPPGNGSVAEPARSCTTGDVAIITTTVAAASSTGDVTAAPSTGDATAALSTGDAAAVPPAGDGTEGSEATLGIRAKAFKTAQRSGLAHDAWAAFFTLGSDGNSLSCCVCLAPISLGNPNWKNNAKWHSDECRSKNGNAKQTTIESHFVAPAANGEVHARVCSGAACCDCRDGRSLLGFVHGCRESAGAFRRDSQAVVIVVVVSHSTAHLFVIDVFVRCFFPQRR